MRDKTLSSVIVVVVGILLVALIFRFDVISQAIRSVVRVMSPIWVAFGLTFIVLTPVKRLDASLTRLLSKKKPREKLCRTLSITICYLTLIIAIVSFLLLVVPQLIISIKSLSVSVTWAYQTYAQDVIAFLEEYNIAGQDARNVLVTWEQVVSTALDMAGLVLKSAASASLSITSNVFNFIIGVVLSVYMIFDKERLSAQCKKALYATCDVRFTNELILWTRKAESIFSGYVTGKMIEALIIGAMTYIAMRLFRMDYAVLIGVLLAVTSIFPIIGPLVGAAVSTIILLIANPMHALWFFIMIIIIEQIDNNFLGPRILGNYTGISSFWTLVALVVGGGFFGAVGMIFSIPVFAMGYAVIRTVCNYRLMKKELPTKLVVYEKEGIVIPEEERL